MSVTSEYLVKGYAACAGACGLLTARCSSLYEDAPMRLGSWLAAFAR